MIKVSLLQSLTVFGDGINYGRLKLPSSGVKTVVRNHHSDDCRPSCHQSAHRGNGSPDRGCCGVLSWHEPIAYFATTAGGPASHSVTSKFGGPFGHTVPRQYFRASFRNCVQSCAMHVCARDKSMLLFLTSQAK